MLDIAKLKPSRRNQIARELAQKSEYEEFSTGPYKNSNMAVLETDRPVLWVNASLRYEKELNVNCRHEYLQNETGMTWNEFKILIQFMDTKQIAVAFKMTKSYITIKGAEFQKWIDIEFKSVKQYVPTPEVHKQGETLEKESKASKLSKQNPAVATT